MGLSQELISQFAKVINESKKQSTESIVYGTVRTDDNGVKYVQLDGSDQLTPMSADNQPTLDVAMITASDGDRVSVLIKDHSATVMGNATSPAVNDGDVATSITNFDIAIGKQIQANRAYFKELTADKVELNSLTAAIISVVDLIAEEADIDNLIANKITVTDLIATKLDVDIADITYATIEKLNATNANIHNLEATYGNFEKLTTNELVAINGIIDNLQVKKLDAETAQITYATITNLNAAVADIGVLNADVADINTLIFGSASGSSIQTSFANAVIAQLGNAQIKSAMIENVSANKITAGDIVTNNVRVMSEDGKLLISDETIQISDNSRVRVQLGKDAAGDYSINIWDADGNLMFSEGGITDNAIKEAIIRNDMVSDNANISAHKLNIDSLFTAINEDGSHTIKSSQIYIDAEKQTLDLVFNDMTTSVNGIRETVSSQGTELEVLQGKITSKIWQQDINTAIDGVTDDIDSLSTQYSTLSQTVNGISATVASHTTDISNKADKTEVTAVNNKVVELELSLDGISTTVSSHTTQLSNKADKSTVASVQTQVSTLEQNVDGFKTTVSSTYATKSALETTNSNVTQLSNKVSANVTSINSLGTRMSAVELTASGLTSRVTTNESNIETALANASNAQTDVDNLETATEENIKQVQNTSNDANTVTNNRITAAESLIQQLSNSISMLVTDSDGSSLMTQTASGGWTFSMAQTNSTVNSISQKLAELQSQTGNTSATVNVLQQSLSDTNKKLDYVNIGTWENEPCINLGESDSDYSLMITNTKILFRVGSSTPTRVTTNGLETENISVNNEIRQGGFVQINTPDGGWGLLWKGVSS